MAQLTDIHSGDINALLVNGGIGLVEPPVRIGGCDIHRLHTGGGNAG